MNISHEKKNSVCVVSLEGRLDNETSQGFQERLGALIDEGETKLVVNLAKLEYISSVGLRAFLVSSKKLKPLNGKLVLSQPQAHIQEVFDIAGFSMLFPAYPSDEEAAKNIA
jgi:anti-anti-sigma factor